jgi:histidine ammonia-lyase
VELLERLQAFLEHDILPLIPEEGSVGASGDLTPLSYVAATLSGEREVLFRGERRQAADVHRELGWTPLVLRPKEALALMNGTAVMTGLACLAFARADYLLQLATRITALNVVALQGNPEHFDERLFAAKPHPGRCKSPPGCARTWPSTRRPRRCIACRTATRCAARPTSSACWPTA